MRTEMIRVWERNMSDAFTSSQVPERIVPRYHDVEQIKRHEGKFPRQVTLAADSARNFQSFRARVEPESLAMVADR
jgi:hypothetical protein